MKSEFPAKSTGHSFLLVKEMWHNFLSTFLNAGKFCPLLYTFLNISLRVFQFSDVGMIRISLISLSPGGTSVSAWTNGRCSRVLCELVLHNDVHYIVAYLSLPSSPLLFSPFSPTLSHPPPQEKILEQIHFHLTGDDDLDSCSTDFCISHRKFALNILEMVLRYSNYRSPRAILKEKGYLDTLIIGFPGQY